MDWKAFLTWLKGCRTWLIDWRTGAGLFVGFLLGLLIFGWPWHLPPAWGDIPTWLLVVLGAVAGWAALGQLRALQKQLADAALEADARGLTERRKLAEDVDVHRFGKAFGLIENKSRRPIKDITCKIMSKVDRRTLKNPSESGTALPGVQARSWSLAPDAKPVSRIEVLRPRTACGFAFDGLAQEPDQVLVAWFTDDAGFRWQLDQYLHLVQSEDESEYLP